MATSKNGIRKPGKVERARARLDAAIRRLEGALADGPESAAADGSGPAEMVGQLESLQAENDRLRALNRTVSERLDAAIGRIHSALEGGEGRAN